MKKVILAIIDGFGENKNSYGNAYLESSHPALDFIYENYSYSLLEASGEFVGLQAIRNRVSRIIMLL